MSFVGMHLDVVTANPDTWSFDPFSMSRDGVSSSEMGGRCYASHVMHHMCRHSHGPFVQSLNPVPLTLHHHQLTGAAQFEGEARHTALPTAK